MSAIKESKAMLEVWEWKEKAYQEVAHLDLGAAIRKRLDDSIQAARERNMPRKRRTPRRPVQRERPGELE